MSLDGGAIRADGERDLVVGIVIQPDDEPCGVRFVGEVGGLEPGSASQGIVLKVDDPVIGPGFAGEVAAVVVVEGGDVAEGIGDGGDQPGRVKTEGRGRAGRIGDSGAVGIVCVRDGEPAGIGDAVSRGDDRRHNEKCARADRFGK